MQQIGAGGFPAFVLEVGEQWFGVPHQTYASDPAGFAAWLSQTIARGPEHSPESAESRA
jgi:protein-disulfide isomerase-like protein with CxxC motif